MPDDDRTKKLLLDLWAAHTTIQGVTLHDLDDQRVCAVVTYIFQLTKPAVEFMMREAYRDDR